MTTATPAPAPVSFSGRDELGPLAMTATEVFVVVAPVVHFGAADAPFIAELMLACLPLGAFVLCPPMVRRTMAVPLPFLAFVVWAVGSVAWSINETATKLDLRTSLPLVLAGLVAAALLPRERFYRALCHSFRLGMALTVVTLLISPGSRFAAASDFGPGLEGWRGGFGHKNVLAIYVVLALVAFVTVDRRGAGRTGSIAVAVVVLVGSRSATGIAAAAAVFLLWMWLASLQIAVGRRLRAGAVAMSGAAVLAAGAMIMVLLPNLLAFYGKDLTFTGRTEIWSAVNEIVAERPLVGHGVGAVFAQPPGPELLEIRRIAGFDVPHPHQGTLDILLDLGFIGLVLYAASMVFTVVLAIRLLSRDPRLAQLVLLTNFAIVIMSLSESVLMGAPMIFVGMTQVLAIDRTNELRRAPDG